MRADDRTLRQLALRVVLGPSKASTRSVAAYPHKGFPESSPALWQPRDGKRKLSESYNADIGFVHDAQLHRTATSTVGQCGTRAYSFLALLSAIGLSLFYLLSGGLHSAPCSSTIQFAQDEVCPQTTGITPQKNSALLAELEATYLSDDFKSKAYESLGGAVRIPCVLLIRFLSDIYLLIDIARTVAYDDLAPPGSDERWEIFAKLHSYLGERFPLVYVSSNPVEVWFSI